MNGTQTISHTYDAADQVVGWTYDGAGNLTSDGTTSYTYDALNHLSGTTVGTQSNSFTYNGDGTLIGATNNGTTTSYTQDLAASQSQILAATTGLTGADYLYGQDTAPLATFTGGVRTWYGIDGQGSVRQTLDDSGVVLGNQNYDPFGQIEAGSSLTSPFGYTGALQNGTTGQEYLRARWYQPGSGTLLGVDPALASTGLPYAYAGNDPTNGSDPSGLAPTQEEIDQLLQHVLNAGINIVEPGDQRPPGNQPWSYFIGRSVHEAIASYYIEQNPDSVVFANYYPVSRILNELGHGADAALGHDANGGGLTARQLAFRPDIVDVTYRRIYEIKPSTDYAGAQTQLNLYLAAFRAAHVYMLMPGPTTAPGTSGIVSAPGGYAAFVSPSPGIILYRKFNGTFYPKTGQYTVPLTVPELNGVLIVVSIFGIVIDIVRSGGQIIESPGSLGGAAFASSTGGSLGTTWLSWENCAPFSSTGNNGVVFV